MRGDSVLTLHEAAKFLGYNSNWLSQGLVGQRRIKCIEKSTKGGVNLRYFLQSELERFKRDYPSRDDLHRNMKFRLEARKQRAAEQRKVFSDPQKMLSLMVDEDYPYQFNPYLFSLDASESTELHEKLSQYFSQMRGLPEATLHSVAGNGVVTCNVDDFLLISRYHVREFLLLTIHRRIHQGTKLEIEIQSLDGEPMTWGFSTRNKLRLD